LYKESRAYKVQLSGRPPSWSVQSSFIYGNYTSSIVWTSPFRVRTLQSLIMVITCSRSATVRMLGQHRPDARATTSRRGLIMEAFSAILERRLQLTVRTLGQAVWTPSSGILVITFYSNIRLGRNQRRWKANKKLCQLII
jgi:hypothetical protein